MAPRYLIALGSNVRHHRHGRPRQVLKAVLGDLEAEGIAVEAAAPVVFSRPIGPSLRRYANGAALVRTRMTPPELLACLKALERRFGRRPGGRRWGSRVLDLDLILWECGAWSSPGLTVPHPRFRERAFVLGPAAAIAPLWRDPITGLSLRQLFFRLRRSRPLEAIV